MVMFIFFPLIYCGRLVPTRLISPFRTFQNCGNSSMEVFLRRNHPRPCPFSVRSAADNPRVIVKLKYIPLHLVLLHEILFSFFSIHMHTAEFIHLELSPILPIRVCLKITGPGEAILIAGMTKIERIPVHTSPISAPAMSISRFANSAPGLDEPMPVDTTTYPAIFSSS